MSRLFHRLSFRRKPRPKPSEGTKSAPVSCPDLTYCVRSNEITGYLNDNSILPRPILKRCLEFIDNMFLLVHVKSVSHMFEELVDERVRQVVSMDVRRIDSEYCSCETLNDGNGTWYQHPGDLRLFVRIIGDHVDILVEEQWTSKEVTALCGVMKFFRTSLTRISLDAAVIELVIANLSLIDLDRWYAFQCFIQAIEDPRVHLNFQNLPIIGDRDAPTQHYWPSVEQLVIRTTERDSVHLARLLDYGVRSHTVLNRTKLEELRVEVEGIEKMNRGLNRNLYHFRCWAGSAGFDDRFSHHFAIGTA
ncbi:unnamed protein product [Bursaphelenchus xylophilus]|uniref:(pine wood nematode) hypothetical protein n=1 Tax=Bursaphelenchus xylophilus TaxID=6326 RepID=A0A1I7S7A9_BURXY|nr:unnamed protein product [Bursaphelenchus xylophilus]CAG9084840.1 unnamed protein product [Bursaphelenchus xylophilus]